MPEIITASELQERENSNFQVQDHKSELVSRANRLRQAIKRAGGNQVIAAKAKVPLSTLTTYLAGGEMKVSNALALATACGVSLEWLVTGVGSMDPHARGDASTAPDPDRSDTRPFKAFASIDVDRMASALESAAQAFATRGSQPSNRDLVLVTLILYDAADTAEGQAAAVAAAERSMEQKGN